MENACFYITMKSNLLNIYKILQLCAGMLIQNWCHKVLSGRHNLFTCVGSSKIFIRGWIQTGHPEVETEKQMENN